MDYITPFNKNKILNTTIELSNNKPIPVECEDIENLNFDEKVSECEIIESPIEQMQEGMAIPHYLQSDPRWKDIPYPYQSGGSNTIEKSACGIVCLSMIASYLTGNKYTPDQLLLDGQYHTKEGTSWDYFSSAVEKFNLGSVKESNNLDETYNSLKEGHPVIASYGKGSLFTSNGHFIVLRGTASDGTVLVNDPSDNQTKNYVNRHFTLDEIQKGNLGFWIFDTKNNNN